MNAALISDVHKAGFELFEVRSGHGLQPIHRLNSTSPKGTIEAVKKEIRTVWEKAKGHEGALRREKARWFAAEFKKMFAEGGYLHDELKKVLALLPQ